jgi:regulator of replication initiation timing
MIKEVLQSNLQLREDLLRMQQQHEKMLVENFQVTVENEDLRDQLTLISSEKGFEVDTA